jgi:hypothetical protein
MLGIPFNQEMFGVEKKQRRIMNHVYSLDELYEMSYYGYKSAITLKNCTTKQ